MKPRKFAQSALLSLVILIPLHAFSIECENEEEKIRAYIIDGSNGTRSGPIRCLTSNKIMKRLNEDLRMLQLHAQDNINTSGLTKPNQKYWTDLPADNIFKK